MDQRPTKTPEPPSTPVVISGGGEAGDDDFTWADHHIQSETAWWPVGESTAFDRNRDLYNAGGAA